MAATVTLHYALCTSHNYAKCYKQQIPSLNPSQFVSSKTLSRLKNKKTHKSRAVPVILAAQSNFLKVVQTVWKVGKNGIEAVTNLVPDSVPRPVARISATVLAVTLALFVLNSVLSTAFFVLAMMGVIYFTFIALNKDEGPKGGGGTPSSTEDSLEEARRIMEKYK